MTIKEQQMLQEFITKKQKFLQKVIEAIQNGDIQKGIFSLNIDSSINIEINKILENYNAT